MDHMVLWSRGRCYSRICSEWTRKTAWKPQSR